MGKSTNQIATKSDVNSKRIGTYSSDLQKCVTKTDVNGWEGLNVHNTYKSLGYYKFYSNTGPDSILAVGRSTTSVSGIATNQIFHYVSNNTLGVYSSNILDIYIECDFYKEVFNKITQEGDGYCAFQHALACCEIHPTVEKRISVTLGGTWGYTQYSTKPSSVYQEYNCFGESGYDFQSLCVVLDSKYNIVQIQHMDDSYMDVNFTMSFIASDTIMYICLVPIHIRFTIDSGSYKSGSYYWSMGIDLYSQIIQYDSYYSSNPKLVKYSDIKQKSFSFNFYYGIWNNKSSSAYLDFIEVYAKTSTGDAVLIGSKELSSVSYTTYGYVTCTLPVTLPLSEQLYFRVRVGKLTANQTWYTTWGNSAFVQAARGWTKEGTENYVTINTQYYALNGSYGILYTENYPSGYRGRYTTNALLFQIE